MISFNGTQKLIICNPETIALNVTLLYSAWKEWALNEGINFLPAFEAIGGQPLPGGLFAGQTYFLVNGWKIRPQSANHRLTIVGNLYTDDGSPVTVAVPGYTVEVGLTTSAQAQGIQTSGATLDVNAIAAAAAFATWNASDRTLTQTFLTLGDIEESTALAKKADLSGLQSFIAPYLSKIHTLWTGSGFDPTNPMSALAPSSSLLGWVRSQDLVIDQVHRQNPDGSFTLEAVSS